jgi:hypothetical protein
MLLAKIYFYKLYIRDNDLVLLSSSKQGPYYFSKIVRNLLNIEITVVEKQRMIYDAW